MAMGLIKGGGFAVDASVMEANASRYHGKAPEDLAWTDKQRQARAVTEYLTALDEVAEPNPDRKTIELRNQLSDWRVLRVRRMNHGTIPQLACWRANGSEDARWLFRVGGSLAQAAANSLAQSIA
jgi:hypothetical protein